MPQCFVSPDDLFLSSDPTGPQGATVLREFIHSALLRAHGAGARTRRTPESAAAELAMISGGLKVDFAPDGEREGGQLDAEDFEEVEEAVYGERETIPPVPAR